MSETTSGLGQGWRRYWRGDEIEATMKAEVGKALRVMAYETRKIAQESIIRRGWGLQQESKRTRMPGGSFTYTTLGAVKRYKQIWRKSKGGAKGTYRYKVVNGQLLRAARVQVYRVSRPGETPTNQRGVLRASISVSPYVPGSSSGDLSVVTGPEAITGQSKFTHWSMTNGLATQALEYGGWTRNHQGKQVRIEARPFMRPAAGQVVNSQILRRQLEGSLVRGWSRGTPALGWSRS